MASSKTAKQTRASATRQNRPPAARTAAKQGPRRSMMAASAGRQKRRTLLTALGGALVALAAVGVLYAVFQHANSSSSSHGGYQVGQPGVGAAAPGFDLAASTGGNVSLADYRGKSVLLYFQEGLTCQPCWDQMTALQKHAAQVKAAGVDDIVSITTDPVNLIAQKTGDMGISIPVLSDPNLAVSKSYHANSYGMMGTSRDGHTFILVGPDGKIRWRADYGGAPKYTMFVQPSQLLSDMRAAMKGST